MPSRRSSNTRRRSHHLSPTRLSAGLHDDPLAYENLTGLVTPVRTLSHGSLDDYVHHISVNGRPIWRHNLVRIGSTAYTIGIIVRDQSTSPASYTFTAHPVKGGDEPHYFRYTPAHGGARRRHTRRHRK
jgi:hypothetical protein